MSKFAVNFKLISYGSADYQKAVALRNEALWKPLGITFTPAMMEQEKNYIHIAGFKDNELCATAMLVPKSKTIMKMQRVAVATNLQGQGIGSAMMKFCEDYAAQHGFQEIYVHARDAAISFYLQNNYIPEGEMFDEDTIPHLEMRKKLTPKLNKNEKIDF